MQIITANDRKPGAFGVAAVTISALRRWIRWAAIALDGMAPRHPYGRYQDLPPEWFKFPPF
jgi:hypothetical protein